MAAAPPQDDQTIPDHVVLWRRIPPLHWVRDDSAPVGHRISSAAFDDPEMSVVIAVECTGGEITLLSGHNGFGIASFTVGDVRTLGWGVVRDPDENLPGHALVLGKKTRGTCLRLAKSCQVLCQPAVQTPE
jgi:hypothetical protein